jgi:hypothetical protein
MSNASVPSGDETCSPETNMTAIAAALVSVFVLLIPHR